MKRLLSLGILFALAAAALAQGEKTLVVRPAAGPLAGRTLYTNSHALLIGVSRYRHLPQNLQLRFADNDARELRDLLVGSYGFPAANITLLLNEQATLENLRKALAAVTDRRRVGPQDRVLVFFSGHGQTVRAEDTDLGFLIPFDADVDLKDPRNAAPYLQSCLSMRAVREYLEACPAKHNLLLADACFSGLLVKSKAVGEQPGGPERLPRQAELKARQVITAGRAGQEAFEIEEKRHGAFSFKLLEQLRALAARGDQLLTASELRAELVLAVSKLTDRRQTPDGGDFGTEGEFLFVSTPAQGSVTPAPPSPGPSVAEPRPGEVRSNPKDGAAMVWVPAGEFLMGASPEELDAAWQRFGWGQELKQSARDESPVHRVRLSRGFWLYRTEVTVAQYRRFCGAGGRSMPRQPAWSGRDDHPVVNVTWEDAKAYCDWAGARLPTEAEWESAARGRDTGLTGQPRRLFPWGDHLPRAGEQAGNVADTASRLRVAILGYNDGHQHTAPVGSFPPNGSGLRDMEGNVCEWCADWYGADYYRASPPADPPGPAGGSLRVLRGGSWSSFPASLRPSSRYGFAPGYRGDMLGFRPARSAL